MPVGGLVEPVPDCVPQTNGGRPAAGELGEPVEVGVGVADVLAVGPGPTGTGVALGDGGGDAVGAPGPAGVPGGRTPCRLTKTRLATIRTATRTATAAASRGARMPDAGALRSSARMRA